MAVSGLLLPSANGLSVPARVFRQALGSLFRQSAATGSLGAVSGVLAGPDNTQGELTLLSDLLVRVQPFVAVIQGTLNTKQGQYVVPNDELVDLGIPAKDASQSRKAYIAVRVADSVEAGVASSAATDGAWLEIQQGALAASNPALPAVTSNTLYLGELLIPSTASGQPVTITKYNPRTTTRGGMLTVFADGLTYPGHSGVAGTHDGQARDLPMGTTYGAGGPQRWSVSRNTWESMAVRDFPVASARQTTPPAAMPAGWQTMIYNTTDLDSHAAFSGATFTVPAGQGGTYAIEGAVLFAAFGAGATLNARIVKNGIALPSSYAQPWAFTGAGAAGLGAYSGRHLVALVAGDAITMQGYSSGGGWSTSIFGDGCTWLSVERVR